MEGMVLVFELPVSNWDDVALARYNAAVLPDAMGHPSIHRENIRAALRLLHDKKRAE